MTDWTDPWVAPVPDSVVQLVADHMPAGWRYDGAGWHSSEASRVSVRRGRVIAHSGRLRLAELPATAIAVVRLVWWLDGMEYERDA